jgi:F-type H+-transporting ATPase subunit gamma
MSLKTIKLKIQSVKKTAKVTRAMEAVSAVKMRKAQQRALGARGYARSAMRILRQVSSSLVNVQHPLTVAHSNAKKIAVVIITSDKGLAGALNSAVLKAVTRLCSIENVSLKDVVALTIGRRGYEFAMRRGFDIRYSDTNVSDSVDASHLQHVADHAIELHTNAEVRSVHLIYTNFKSTFEQTAVIRQLLPLSVPTIMEMVDGILPDKGKFSTPRKQDAKEVSEYLIEPDAETVVSQLIPKLANIAVFHALLESKASEHSARMVAMKAATDNAKTLAGDLTLQFNRERQASITAEVSEITSGMEAMK